MCLAFCGAGANGSPANQIGNILWRDQVEVLGAGGYAHVVDVAQQLPSQTQAFVDFKTIVITKPFTCKTITS